MKVWVLTTGEYSDYRVRGVFSSEEKAIAYAAGLPDANLPPDEYEVDECKPSADRFWSVSFTRDGDVFHLDAWWRTDNMRESIHQFKGDGSIAVGLFADTRERAIKVANERRARFLVEGA